MTHAGERRSVQLPGGARALAEPLRRSDPAFGPPPDHAATSCAAVTNP
jgi:hypothetical protein